MQRQISSDTKSTAEGQFKTGSNTWKILQPENFSPNPVDNRILAEIDDEDYGSGEESARMRKKMLISANISALTVNGL